MNYSKVFIDSISFELPDIKIATSEIETRLKPVLDALKFPSGQIEALTGIRERRWWPVGFTVSDGAIVAGEKALRKAGFAAQDLDALIYAGVCRDYFEPATACRVASELGVKEEAVIYDISNACLGVLNGMIDIANRIELGQIKAGMVVSCESAREINEEAFKSLEQNHNMDLFVKTFATFTGGSGATAVILSDGSLSGKKKRKLLGAVSRNSNRHHSLCRWGVKPLSAQSLKQFMSTDAVAVLKHGVSLGLNTWQAFLKELGWRSEGIDRVISHQVGSSHRRTIMRALELPEEIDYASYPLLGNMGTVSLPLTAALAEEKGFLVPGHRVSFLGIGSGLNCLMMGLEW